MQFQILALRPFDPAPVTGYCAEMTVGYADMTIVGCHLGHDDFGKPFVAFPKLAGMRARIHVKESGTRTKLVNDAAALYRAMTVAAATPLAKASPYADTFHEQPA